MINVWYDEDRNLVLYDDVERTTERIIDADEMGSDNVICFTALRMFCCLYDDYNTPTNVLEDFAKEIGNDSLSLATRRFTSLLDMKS